MPPWKHLVIVCQSISVIAQISLSLSLSCVIYWRVAISQVDKCAKCLSKMHKLRAFWQWLASSCFATTQFASVRLCFYWLLYHVKNIIINRYYFSRYCFAIRKYLHTSICWGIFYVANCCASNDCTCYDWCSLFLLFQFKIPAKFLPNDVVFPQRQIKFSFLEFVHSKSGCDVFSNNPGTVAVARLSRSVTHTFQQTICEPNSVLLIVTSLSYPLRLAWPLDEGGTKVATVESV